MPDWTKSMERTFEYYIVDPGTWKDIKRLDFIKSSFIDRDLSVETLGSAKIDVADVVGECYIRIYLITIQNGIREKHPLGTFLIQTPSSKFDGKKRNVTMDAFTPLIELKENQPPIGYTLPEGENIMKSAYTIIREKMRAPVFEVVNEKNLEDDFVMNANDKWLSFISDLVGLAKYTIGLDEMGRILFVPKQDTASLQPVWTYDDSNSSILYPEITMNHDMFGIPNVVEVLYTKSGDYFYARIVNDDENSPTSTINRGREITYRETDPNMVGVPTQRQVEEYARQLLRDMSSVDYSVTYSHGYCPVRLGDCVRLNYNRAGLTDIKARVISQSISCSSSCKVTETAVFTKKLWE